MSRTDDDRRVSALAEWRVGDVVRNAGAPSWGRGLVVALEGHKLHIRFEQIAGDALKVLDSRAARLSRCEGEALTFAPAVASRPRGRRESRGSGMRFWIVKGRDELTHWDRIRRGSVWNWITRRPPKDLAVGDGVFFWRATPHCCVVGIGAISSAPEWSPGEAAYRYGIESLSGFVRHPLLKPELVRDEVVGSASFLKIGMASGIVALHELEARRLADLFAERNGNGARAPWWSRR